MSAAMCAQMSEPLLELRDLCVAFRGRRGVTEVLSRASLTVNRGEIVGVVGESGSGKSVMALAIMRLLGAEGMITGGQIRFEGRDLGALGEPELRSIRGRRIGMVFQEPMTSLNPLFRVGYQLGEVLATHFGLSGVAARRTIVELLGSVGIASAAERADAYPHQLSGGMRQRVMIAMAMACEPRLLIADEPTTALDVTIQAQILELMRRIRREAGTAILLITHDMGVIARMADRVVVVYAGQIVEDAPLRALFERPAHPYTRLLLDAVPTTRRKSDRLPIIPGALPAPGRLPGGCRFHPRCPMTIDECRSTAPQEVALGEGDLSGSRSARCLRVTELLAGPALGPEAMG
jgi:oligopeptide/dipeptide ABC transporter ATP-binding protein